MKQIVEMMISMTKVQQTWWQSQRMNRGWQICRWVQRARQVQQIGWRVWWCGDYISMNWRHCWTYQMRVTWIHITELSSEPLGPTQALTQTQPELSWPGPISIWPSLTLSTIMLLLIQSGSNRACWAVMPLHSFSLPHSFWVCKNGNEPN